MEQASPRQLFNTSWTLHRLSPLHHGKDYNELLDNPAALKAYATRLRDQLTGDVLAGLHASATTAEDDALSKTGALRNCLWQPLSTKSSRDETHAAVSFPGILVTLEYENITYKASLLADPDPASGTNTQREGSTHLPLLLTKFPAPLRQTFITFLSANFDTYCASLRLPSSFLCTGLETFIDGLRGSMTRPAANEIVAEMIRELQLTLAFSPSIAPALRSLNVSISRTTLTGFLRDEREGSQGTQQKLRSPLIQNLTSYLESHLAMKLDLDGSAGNKLARQHVRLSKVACAAFVLGSDGRMKLVVDFELDGDESGQRSPALLASDSLLRMVIRKAVLGDQAVT